MAAALASGLVSILLFFVALWASAIAVLVLGAVAVLVFWRKPMEAEEPRVAQRIAEITADFDVRCWEAELTDLPGSENSSTSGDGPGTHLTGEGQ